MAVHAMDLSRTELGGHVAVVRVVRVRVPLWSLRLLRHC